jgi:hypothetical protein
MRSVLVDVEHADHVIADHVARGTRLGHHLVQCVLVVRGAEHLDRDGAAELAIMCLPHRRGRAGVEAHRQLVAVVAGVAEAGRIVLVLDLVAGMQPQQCLLDHRRVVGEVLRELVAPAHRRQPGELAQHVAHRFLHTHPIPCSMPCSTTR